MSVHNRKQSDTSVSTVDEHPERSGPQALLLTVEEVAAMWFGEVGAGGSASSNCQKIRRLIPDVLPARRIGNRWYVSRATAEEWIAGSDDASVMAHPDTRAAMQTTPAASGRRGAE